MFFASFSYIKFPRSEIINVISSHIIIYFNDNNLNQSTKEASDMYSVVLGFSAPFNKWGAPKSGNIHFTAVWPVQIYACVCTVCVQWGVYSEVCTVTLQCDI